MMNETIPINEAVNTNSSGSLEDETKTQKSVRYLLGLSCISVACVVWIGASVLTQYMYDEAEIQSPFLMTYAGVALLVLLFPAQEIISGIWCCSQGTNVLKADCLPDDASFEEAISKASAYGELLDVLTTRSLHHATTTKQWSHKKHALAALNLAPAMFLSDYAYNTGLQHTTVSSCTVLISTSSVFVLVLSLALKLEHFTISRIVGVLLAVVGTVLTTMQDALADAEAEQDKHHEDTLDQLLGDVVALMAAVGYAVYSVQARLFCPEKDELYSLPLLLSYVGILCAVPLMPMAVYELAQIKWTYHTFAILIVKGLIDFAITDYLMFRAIMLTNATVANVGLVLTIPFAFTADFLLKGSVFSAMQLAGAGSVLLGFVLVNVSDSSILSSCGQKQIPATIMPNDPTLENQFSSVSEISPPTHPIV